MENTLMIKQENKSILKNIDLESDNRSILIKSIDYGLYFATFGGITFISGTIVHALQFSLYSVLLFFIGLVISPLATILRDKLTVIGTNQKPKAFQDYVSTIVTSVSSGIVAGGILHWQESPRFGLYVVIGGLVMALTATFLYSTKSTKETISNFFISLAMFSGISFISGSVVHSMNSWFNNSFLIFIGIALTPGALVIKEKLSGKKNLNLIKDAILLIFLSLGIGGITGGVLHFEVNVAYAMKLIIGGLIISYTAAMFKNNGSLADLRK
jgi:MFS family permease